MLTLREKLIVLFATAPQGFSINADEVTRKYDLVTEDHAKWTLANMKKRGEVERDGKNWVAGPVVREEVGAV